MAQISGIPVENITNMYGANVTSIISIGGIPTTSIPGWPSGGGCITLSLGHSSFRPPTQACMAPRNDYQFDTTKNILYGIGEPCDGGGILAPNGFYSDGIIIYSWFDEIWGVGGPCR